MSSFFTLYLILVCMAVSLSAKEVSLHRGERLRYMKERKFVYGRDGVD